MFIPAKSIPQMVTVMKAECSVRITKCVFTDVKQTNFILQNVKPVIHICMIAVYVHFFTSQIN